MSERKIKSEGEGTNAILIFSLKPKFGKKRKIISFGRK